MERFVVVGILQPDKSELALGGLLPELGCQKLFDVGEGILNGFGQNTQSRSDKGRTRRRRIEKWSESDLVDSSPVAGLGTKRGTEFEIGHLWMQRQR